MPPGGEASRGRGGKFNKAKRGGGKHFSRNLTPLDADGNPVSMWADPRDVRKSEDSDDQSEDESSEEESGDEEEPQQQEVSREERRAIAKAKKEAAIAKKKQRVAEPGDLPTSSEDEEEDAAAEGGLPSNPNHTAKSMAQAAGSSKDDSKPELSRREREALEAQQARERYQKLHAEGKTDEARADLARLKLIREQRDAAAARKQAEKEEREAAEQRRLAEMDERERKKREAALGSAKKKSSKKAAK